MELLRENEERVLTKLLGKNQDYEQFVTGETCEESTLFQLKDLGYILIIDHSKSISCGFTARVQVTENGKHYFEDKKVHLEKEKAEHDKRELRQKKEDRKFWISLCVSLGALVISVISLILKYVG